LLALESDLQVRVPASKWELLAPGVCEIHLPHNSYSVTQVPGDGNCLTSCVREILHKRSNKLYEVKDLKLWLALQVYKRLVKVEVDSSYDIENGVPVNQMMKNFLSTFGNHIIDIGWMQILRQLDAPDEGQKKSSTKKFVSDMDEIISKIDRQKNLKLKVIHEEVFQKVVLQDKYYLPSEALEYYCEAFSFNISVWYPNVNRAGSYVKRDEYGVEHSQVFMLRQCQYELSVNETTLRSGEVWKSWNQAKELMNCVTAPHFDVLFLKENGQIELYTDRDFFLGTATLTNEFELVSGNKNDQSFSPSLSSGKHPKRGKISFY
jgi:hypothetical protein